MKEQVSMTKKMQQSQNADLTMTSWGRDKDSHSQIKAK